jgi:ribonuclease PH
MAGCFRLDYIEDSGAQADANFVLTGAGKIVEIQGTAEQTPFEESQFQDLLRLARKGAAEIALLQKQVIGEI